MSAFKKSSKSLLKESLRILDEDFQKLPENKRGSNREKDLLKTSSIKEIEAVKKQLKRKRGLADENIKKLKLLNQSLKDKTAKKILENIGYKAESSKESKKKKPEDEKTVFTEEDFARFEREYFAT